MLAAVRPNDWNLPLLTHVAGAMLLVGGLVAVAAMLLRASSNGEPSERALLGRFGFRTLLVVVLPSFVLMRAGAEWIASKEGRPESTWIGIGYTVADLGFLVMIVAIVVAGLAVRRQRKGMAGPGALGRIATGLTLLLLAAYVVAIWAMTAKPA